MTLLGVGFAFASAVALALSNVVVRKALVKMNSRVCAAITVATAVPLLGGAILIQGELSEATSLDLRSIVMLGVSGLFTFVLGRVLFYGAIQTIGTNRANSFIATSPVFAIVLGFVFLEEEVSLAEWAAVLIVMSGIVLVSESGSGAVLNEGRRLRRGSALALTAAALAGVAQFLVRGAVAGTGLPLWSLLISYASSMFVLLPVSVTADLGKLKSALGGDKESALLLATSAGALSAMGHAFRYTALESSPLYVVSSVGAVEPLLVILLSFALIRSLEHFNVRLLTGSGLVVLGILAISLGQ